MSYRKISTDIWEDPWFEDLSPNAKLAFMYLWTNKACTAAGIYEISEKRIKFDLGYGIDTIYSEIKDKIYWDRDRKLIWVKNFFRWQCQNHKFAISALNSIKDNPYKLGLFIEYNQGFLESFKDKDGNQLIDLTSYHTDTISIPYPNGIDTISPRAEAETVSEADPETATATEACGGGGGCQEKTPIKAIIEIWNEAVERNQALMPKVMAITVNTSRYNHVRARWKEHPDLESWRTMADMATQSDFLNGKTRNRERPMSFDWIVQSAGNLTKVLEGKYRNNDSGSSSGSVDRSAGSGYESASDFPMSYKMKHNLAAAEAFINAADDE